MYDIMLKTVMVMGVWIALIAYTQLLTTSRWLGRGGGRNTSVVISTVSGILSHTSHRTGSGVNPYDQVRVILPHHRIIYAIQIPKSFCIIVAENYQKFKISKYTVLTSQRLFKNFLIFHLLVCMPCLIYLYYCSDHLCVCLYTLFISVLSKLFLLIDFITSGLKDIHEQ